LKEQIGNSTKQNVVDEIRFVLASDPKIFASNF